MRDILAGIKLADMADVGRQRKKKICFLFCAVSSALFFIYGCLNYYSGHLLIASTNFTGFALCMVNLYPLWQPTSDYTPPVAFNLALIMNCVVTVALPLVNENQILWIYPAIAALIYVNEFRVSLFISILLCLLALLTFMQSNNWQAMSLSTLSNDRLFISLLATSVICLMSNFYYNKAISYIQELYVSGIEELAYTDRLTGLANRWSFEKWANRTLDEQRYSSNLTALIFLDVDNFKQINDTYGHNAGDELLQYVAKRLANNVRTSPRNNKTHNFSVARYAGDEFLLLLHDISSRQDLEKIVERISRLFSDNEGRQSEFIASLTFSIGIAIFRRDADNLDDLIRCADKAMYEAKKHGKNRYIYYQAQTDTQRKVKHLHIA